MINAIFANWTVTVYRVLFYIIQWVTFSISCFLSLMIGYFASSSSDEDEDEEVADDQSNSNNSALLEQSTVRGTIDNVVSNHSHGASILSTKQLKLLGESQNMNNTNEQRENFLNQSHHSANKLDYSELVSEDGSGVVAGRRRKERLKSAHITSARANMIQDALNRREEIMKQDTFEDEDRNK